MSASSFLDALYDSAFFAINCDVLLEASIIDNENGYFGLSGVWQAGLFDLESYFQRDRKSAPCTDHARLSSSLCPALSLTPYSVPRARPVHSHPLPGIWVIGRSQDARLVRGWQRKHAVASPGEHIPL